MKLLLVLALIGCGLMQTDYVWDIYDIGFVAVALALFLSLFLGVDEEFWKNLGR